MSGYDTHHADLAQTAGFATVVDFGVGLLWGALILGLIWIVYVVTVAPLFGLWVARWERRYDRDHARQRDYDNRTQGETFPERVQRINGEKR